MGGTPYSLLSCSVSPRDVSPPIGVSQHVCKTPRALDVAHFTLFSCAVQDGELFLLCVVLRAHRHVVRHAKDVASPPDG